MPNDLIIRNGFISRESSTVIGSFSATTYLGIPSSPSITGGTYSSTGGTLSLNNSTGGTINITGFGEIAEHDYQSPYSYMGRAPIGTLTTNPIWIITRITINTDGSTVVQTATGAWTNRYSLIYT